MTLSKLYCLADHVDTVLKTVSATLTEVFDTSPSHFSRRLISIWGKIEGKFLRVEAEEVDGVTSG
jgi:hypothetical protein